MVRDGRFKYVAFRDAPELLFDLEADPAEQHNLADSTDRTADQDAALTRLRSLVEETMDFEAAVTKRAADGQRASKQYALKVPSGTSMIGNSYHLDDGRIVNAEATVMSPELHVENPAQTFDDYPGSAEGDDD